MLQTCCWCKSAVLPILFGEIIAQPSLKLIHAETLEKLVNKCLFIHPLNYLYLHHQLYFAPTSVLPFTSCPSLVFARTKEYSKTTQCMVPEPTDMVHTLESKARPLGKILTAIRIRATPASHSAQIEKKTVQQMTKYWSFTDLVSVENLRPGWSSRRAKFSMSFAWLDAFQC